MSGLAHTTTPALVHALLILAVAAVCGVVITPSRPGASVGRGLGNYIETKALREGLRP